jgi:co-chaperonin GroES (HSP10)
MAKPLGNKIILKRILEGEKKTQAGLILAPKKEPLSKSVVVEPPTHVDVNIKKGDVVLHPSDAGSPAVIDGDEVLIISFDEVWAIL